MRDGDVTTGLLQLPTARQEAGAARRQELELRFCVLLNEERRAQQVVQQCHDEMMKIQGALEELARTPDAPQGQVGGGA